jgi:hypothetical protein
MRGDDTMLDAFVVFSFPRGWKDFSDVAGILPSSNGEGEPRCVGRCPSYPDEGGGSSGPPTQAIVPQGLDLEVERALRSLSPYRRQ